MRARLPQLPYLLVSAIPFVLSFALFRLVRTFLRAAKARYLARNPASRNEWQLMDSEFIRKPLVLPLIMTGAPRWNTHAIIATLGPFPVERTLSICTVTARESAGEWFFVIYSHPGQEIVGSISSLGDSGDDWQSFTVPRSGEYALGARYYQAGDTVHFPEVRSDGEKAGAQKQGSAEANAFYTTLRQREGLFYRALQWYVYPMLRCRDWFSDGFVRREFLPVGNPETDFLFGPLKPGEPLVLNLDSALFARNHVYVTIYSRASFPIASFELEPPGKLPESCITTEPRFYLVRIQRKSLSRGVPFHHVQSFVPAVQ